MKIRPHKVGSVTSRLSLDRGEVEISRMVEARSGQVVVVKALEEKRVYDQIELTTGRMAHVGKGDVIVGALGRRDALRGFQGVVPSAVKAGDTLHLLNLGGVIGQAVSENRDFGHPLRCEVLGMAIRNGKGLNIADAAIPTADHVSPADCPPLIVVSGTCMNSGKTVACCEIIAKLSARGYACAGLKLTGVACQKDLLNMEDHGALATLSFLLPLVTKTLPAGFLAAGALFFLGLGSGLGSTFICSLASAFGVSAFSAFGSSSFGFGALGFAFFFFSSSTMIST